MCSALGRVIYQVISLERTQILLWPDVQTSRLGKDHDETVRVRSKEAYCVWHK